MSDTQVVFRAPLCGAKGAKCGNRTWSPTGLCHVHRKRRQNDTALMPSGIMQRLASPTMVRREQKRDKRAANALSARVGKVVPIFDGNPSVDDLESAGQHILFSSWADDGVRRAFQQMGEDGLGGADAEPGGLAFSSVDNLSESEVAAAVRRRDRFGLSARDASIVSGYLFHKAWELAQSEAVGADSEGIPFDVPVGDYLSMKMETMGTGNPNFARYRDSIGERVTAERERRRYMAEVEDSRMETMVQAAQELGTKRMNAEEEGVDPKELAWGNAPIEDRLGYVPGPRFRLPRGTGWKPSRPSPTYIDESTRIVYDENMNPLGKLPGQSAPRPPTAHPPQAGYGISVPAPSQVPTRVGKRFKN